MASRPPLLQRIGAAVGVVRGITAGGRRKQPRLRQRQRVVRQRARRRRPQAAARLQRGAARLELRGHARRHARAQLVYQRVRARHLRGPPASGRAAALRNAAAALLHCMAQVWSAARMARLLRHRSPRGRPRLCL
jgi:hypothetical protein